MHLTYCSVLRTCAYFELSCFYFSDTWQMCIMPCNVSLFREKRSSSSGALGFKQHVIVRDAQNMK